MQDNGESCILSLVIEFFCGSGKLHLAISVDVKLICLFRLRNFGK